VESLEIGDRGGLIPNFNLIATTNRREESWGCTELWMLLRDIEDPKPIVDRSSIYGLIAARTNLNPMEAIGKLREELGRRPEAFRHLIRVMPVETVVPSEIERIKEAVQSLSERVGEGESFRITVEKRRTPLRSKEIIEAVAEGINRGVDLENPDWVILIEVIGKYTGISVIRPSEILNTVKERVATDEQREGQTSPREEA